MSDSDVIYAETRLEHVEPEELFWESPNDVGDITIAFVRDRILNKFIIRIRRVNDPNLTKTLHIGAIVYIAL